MSIPPLTAGRAISKNTLPLTQANFDAMQLALREVTKRLAIVEEKLDQ